MGLYAIRKRIETLAGKLTIDSVLGKGTTVIIDIPL
jgi:signal transduction histidine kinase